ncbi:MAG: sn-glycerol-3-phosphate ABC transporter ATP-binding protein UgpC [Albidovulum sp.]|nr:sn-glycerol-3-phosphate ABC transporter ATP-binding protein UgpC [Albidovulum sp.]MDE0305745.1 sn-glycerol-3-phosphate ABC transporter ATP-binding protein UgpC [Albidovulum sp.]
MAQVVFSSVGKDFGRDAVLRDVEFEVPAGRFVALIGPSGCGKSTLLRMIAGLEHIDYGEIYIDGNAVNDLAPKDRDVAMVFQNYALYPHMTVAENMLFTLRMARRTRAESNDRMWEAARILGLEDLLDRYPRHLSGGQRQRVAMGRAIVRNPKVFLFDEPLSNLDAKLRVQMRAEIKRLHQRLGATMIFVTHDQVEAMTMAEQVIILREGRIEQVGTPLELYDRPANVFVAGFIGSPAMNLMGGTFERARGQLCFLPQSGSPIPIPPGALPGADKTIPGQNCLLGIRPEHITLPGSGPDSEDGEPFGEIPVDVVLVEVTGLDTHIVASAPSGEITILIRGRFDTVAGDRLQFRLNFSLAHVFDAETGERMG